MTACLLVITKNITNAKVNADNNYAVAIVEKSGDCVNTVGNLLTLNLWETYLSSFCFFLNPYRSME